MRRAISLLVLVAVLTLATGAVSTTAGATETCEAIDGEQLCLDDVSISSEELVAGETGTLSISITNEGETDATASVVLVTVDPENETNALKLRDTTLESGGSTTFTKDLDASTPGTHALQVRLLDPDTGRTFDTSEALTVEVLDEQPARLGGPIDRTEIAAVVLIGAVVALGGLIARELR